MPARRRSPRAAALQEALAARWTTATAEETTHSPGEPGVRLRCHLDDACPSAHRSFGAGQRNGPER
ncbi:DUF6207 family protein [Streptomyces sp. T21Q-yed]|uniref:DUF6207 family protein n=1 Tax=Streptomyces sp. T12 TaxID=477697 RepID=UPI00236541A3|nr:MULTISPECIES: DUF6207 family protein [unclassified Streptomyces]MDF3141419.1 DUF6207 family protein [Streptomyces sp. T21Q-yed]WDF44488.1 DUF6207 family protein [Streptomyces sp. T12]WDF44979.1 DUF6207 family protein [Streptomyces sp. T12]